MARCEDCDFGLLEFFYKYTGKARDLFDVCVRHKLVLDEKNCSVCGRPATLDFNQKIWRCQRMQRVLICTSSHVVLKTIHRVFDYS